MIGRNTPFAHEDSMQARLQRLAETFLQKPYADLPPRDQEILQRLVAHATVSRDLSVSEAPSFGDRVADRVAQFGGSWRFIGLFSAALVLWVGFNTVVAARAIDPYPFVFLNLILSMVAAFQAPVIMMAQNRQSAADRIAAAHDYEVNLKAELEIMRLHEKVDAMRTETLEARFDRIEAILARVAPPV
jgi:uncharacterized membrane protein